MLVLHVPFLQDAFRTSSLSADSWAILVGTAATVIPVLEGAKWWLRRSEGTRAT
jgi:Ca2+-transporting ATPase